MSGLIRTVLVGIKKHYARGQFLDSWRSMTTLCGLPAEEAPAINRHAAADCGRCRTIATQERYV